MAMQEGLANVCLVGRSVTMVCAKIEGNIPKKRGAAAGYDKALSRFMDKVGADHQTWQALTLKHGNTVIPGMKVNQLDILQSIVTVGVHRISPLHYRCWLQLCGMSIGMSLSA